MSAPEELFSLQLRAAKLPEANREYRFHPVRKFRFDFAWPAAKLAVEIDGGLWVMGRHNRGRGAITDMEKGNLAVAEGWSVLHFVPEQVKSGEALKFVEPILRGRINADNRRA